MGEGAEGEEEVFWFFGLIHIVVFRRTAADAAVGSSGGLVPLAHVDVVVVEGVRGWEEEAVGEQQLRVCLGAVVVVDLGSWGVGVV